MSSKHNLIESLLFKLHRLKYERELAMCYSTESNFTRSARELPAHLDVPVPKSPEAPFAKMEHIQSQTG